MCAWVRAHVYCACDTHLAKSRHLPAGLNRSVPIHGAIVPHEKLSKASAAGPARYVRADKKKKDTPGEQGRGAIDVDWSGDPCTAVLEV